MLHYRQIINENAVTAYQKYVVNWDNFPPSHLSNTQNTTTQEYDALNRIRKAYYPKDRANQRKIMEPTYNKGGALQAVKVGTTDYVSEIAYNARGQRILMAMGNGMMTRYTYNPETFRLTRTKSEKFTKSGHTYTPNGGTQQDLAYSYDLEGTILSQRDKAPANTSAQGPGDLLREFEHDPLRRLTSASGRESSNVYQQPSWDLNVRPQDYTNTNDYIRAFSYDKLGNIQELAHRATGHSNQDFVRNYVYSGDFNNNQLKQFTYASNTYGYQYDPNGNITKEGTTRNYFWNAGDKLAAYSNQVGTSTPTVYTWYFYNAAGERVKKLVKKGQSLEVTFYCDGGIFETSYVKPTGGSIDNNRFYNTLHVLDGNSRIATVRIGNDTDDSTPQVKYYLEDHLMDSLVVLKTDGTLINREEFYPFGETSFGGYGKKRYRFNGKEKDEESGLYNYGQRYYAPWLCRFVSVDPIAEDYPQLSSYNYAGNKPITSPDIDGLQGTEDPPQTITDGAGRESLIDPGAQIVEGDTAVLSQEGEKYVNVNGVGLVKEVHLSGNLTVEKAGADNPGDNNMAKNILSEVVPIVTEETGKKLQGNALKRAMKKVDDGTLVGTNNEVYQSTKKTKVGKWAHKGNQYFTTKGLDPLRHSKILGWRNVAGKGLKALGQSAGSTIGIASMITDDRNNPFSLLPISFVTDTQLKEYDMLDQEFLDRAISEGYDSVNQHLIAQRGNQDNLAMKDLKMEAVQPDVLWELMEGNYASHEALLEAINSSSGPASYGVLIKFTHDSPGFQMLGVFNKPF